MSRRSSAVLTAMLAGMFPSMAAGQTAIVTPITVGDAVVAGSLRSRAYSWSWFGNSPDGDYNYPGSLLRIGITRPADTYEVRVEAAVPILFNLPAAAVAPAPRGQLGLGASYAAANPNSRDVAALFLKQATVRLKALGGIAGQSLMIGRMEFNDGAEVVPKNTSLAILKRDRISQRLLGNFGFSDVGRSIDGAMYSLNWKQLNLTSIAGRPTQGVFQVDGWGELNINVGYAAVTGQAGTETSPAEWRVFVLGYDDYRHGAVKTDSRSAAARGADAGSIKVGTFGAHYLHMIATPAGPVDVLLWGALQNGSWGALDHTAVAFAVESGWQPASFKRFSTWLRAGYDYASGDHDPQDGTHGTFFQVLPTPRVYARLPFYNMMNTEDAFGEVTMKPTKRLAVRADVHALRLADANDLWYSGGGAFQPATFGYSGRPSNGHAELATLYDVSGDYALSPRVSIGLYVGHASSGTVAGAIYSSGGAHLAYAELLCRF
jgi:hypothetical protein